jgi:hypothetical protein
MAPNVTFCGYAFVPLLPYLERERPFLCGKNSLEWGSRNAWGQNGLPRGLDLTTQKAAYRSPKNSAPLSEVAFFRPQVPASKLIRT